MVMEKIMLPEVVKVNRVLTRKMCIVGATELLTETPELFSGHYSYLWYVLLFFADSVEKSKMRIENIGMTLVVSVNQVR